MITHFYPETVFTIVTQPTLTKLVLPFQNNLILRLPTKTICQWLAYNRLGSFMIKNDNITFSPGIERRDIYSPIIESLPIFELAYLFHEHEICSHVEFLQTVMTYREYFITVISQSTQTELCEVHCLQSLKRFKPISRAFKVRVKRKNRPSKYSTNISAEFFTYLTQKGHYDWTLL